MSTSSANPIRWQRPAGLSSTLRTSGGNRCCASRKRWRYFEAIFLQPAGQPGTVRARIFDLFDELPFAGHRSSERPAVCTNALELVAHKPGDSNCPARQSKSPTDVTAGGYSGVCSIKVRREFLRSIADSARSAAASISRPIDLAPDLPLEVVSTGPPLPDRCGSTWRTGTARISHDITELVQSARRPVRRPARPTRRRSTH